MSAPRVEHYLSSKNIIKKLLFIEQEGKGIVFYASVDLYLDKDKKKAYQPDIMVILEGSKARITSKGIYGPPDVVVEILSRSTARKDRTVKKEAYERAGVKEYWIVDPLRKSFEIYLNTEEGFKLISKAKDNGKVKSHVLGLELDLQEVFEGIELLSKVKDIDKVKSSEPEIYQQEFFKGMEL